MATGETTKGWAREFIAAEAHATAERDWTREEYAAARRTADEAARAFVLAAMPASADRDYLVGRLALSATARRRVCEIAAEVAA